MIGICYRHPYLYAGIFVRINDSPYRQDDDMNGRHPMGVVSRYCV